MLLSTPDAVVLYCKSQPSCSEEGKTSRYSATLCQRGVMDDVVRNHLVIVSF